MKRFKNVILFIGFVLAGISAIAYLILLYIIITGFEIVIASHELLIFLILGAIAGLMISLSLRIQGISLAKNENNDLYERLHLLTGKDLETKLFPMWAFHLINIVKDILVKGVSMVVTLYFSITIIIKGLGDFKYFWLGIVNILLYFGFGFLALVKAYEHTLANEIPLVRQKIKILEKKEEPADELPRKIDTNSSGVVREERESGGDQSSQISAGRDISSGDAN